MDKTDKNGIEDFPAPREAGLNVVGMCSRKGTKSASTPPSSLSFSTRRVSQTRPSFLWPAPTKTRTGGKELSCFSQKMWKATRDPYGTVLYAHTKSSYIKPPFNAIIPSSLDLLQMLTHQTKILLTLIRMSHPSNPHSKNSSLYTQSNTKHFPYPSIN